MGGDKENVQNPGEEALTKLSFVKQNVLRTIICIQVHQRQIFLENIPGERVPDTHLHGRLDGPQTRCG
jgi:hypothetical protein